MGGTGGTGWSASDGESLIFGFATDAVGALLVGLSIYSKISALRVAGEFGWYWGDFFFLRTGSRMLSFDGVFELVPHVRVEEEKRREEAFICIQCMASVWREICTLRNELLHFIFSVWREMTCLETSLTLDLPHTELHTLNTELHYI